MSKILLFASFAALFFSAAAGCGGEYVDDEIRTASSAKKVFPAARFKNAKYSTCIESSQLRMARCSSSVTQRLIGVIVSSRGMMNLRFAGTNQCLKQVDKNSVTTGKCSDSKRKLWIPSGSSRKIRFRSAKNGKFLKAAPRLKVGNPDGKSLWRISEEWRWLQQNENGGNEGDRNEGGGNEGSGNEGDGDSPDKGDGDTGDPGIGTC